MAACSATFAQPQLTLVSNQVSSPLDIASLRDGQTMLVVQQGGKIVRLERDQLDLSTPYLDISSEIAAGGERGLLGIAVHPQYATNGYVYVNYTRAGDGATVIARYTRDAANPKQASLASKKIVLTVDQPFANHNGGALRFGADGYLYIGMGDGGSGNDPQKHAQNMQSLLGKMLRIDVNRGDPYSVPNDNPFASNPSLGKPEIFAAGLRNPWRFSVDRVNGDIFIGDVGQDALEEVSLIGAVSTLQFPRELINFGWRTFEGTRCTNLDGSAACASGRFTPPILEYGRSDGASITGGIRYTGSKVPELSNGHNYVFGDFVSGRIWQATRGANNTWTRKELFATGGNIASFGEDDSGEIYVLDYSKGIFKITSTTAPATNDVVKTAIEYYNTPLQHYFITADQAEQRSVESGGAGPGWSRTGLSFKVLSDVSTLLPAPGVSLSSVCRFYGTPGKGPNSHFYTADDSECTFVKRDLGWTFEGNVFFVAKKGSSQTCPGGYVPVYRTYNNRFAQNDSNHRYTIDESTHRTMVRNGWADEGVVFCAVAS
jgi:glucose/arabinose dehydrogenase